MTPVFDETDFVADGAGSCTATIKWTHPTPRKVAAYYVVLATGLASPPPTPTASTPWASR